MHEHFFVYLFPLLFHFVSLFHTHTIGHSIRNMSHSPLQTGGNEEGYHDDPLHASHIEAASDGGIGGGSSSSSSDDGGKW